VIHLQSERGGGKERLFGGGALDDLAGFR